MNNADILSRVNCLTRHLHNFASELAALKHTLESTNNGDNNEEQITINYGDIKYENYDEPCTWRYPQFTTANAPKYGNVTVVAGVNYENR